jgi:heme ABC exporter ATP-binding subunit CcmA
LRAVETHDLGKRYGAVRALRGVSVELPAEAVTLVVGPNGAGKSTLLRVLACLTRPTSGSVRIFGRDPFGREGPGVRSAIGWLGPDSGLYADLTVEENLAFTAQLHGHDTARREWALEELGLSPVRHRLLRTLSQGYRRRAGLARTLLPQPTLLLLDEPWNGLDDEASERLTRALQNHRAGGGTLVVAAHAASAARELADHTLHLEAGELRTIQEAAPNREDV